MSQNEGSGNTSKNSWTGENPPVLNPFVSLAAT
jgi:hypothetical protein